MVTPQQSVQVANTSMLQPEMKLSAGLSNTPLNCQTTQAGAHTDTIEIRYPSQSLEDILTFISRFTDYRINETNEGSFLGYEGYPYQMVLSCGIKIYFRNELEPGELRVHIEGKCSGHMGTRLTVKIVRMLSHLKGADIRRLDIKVRLPDWLITSEELEELGLICKMPHLRSRPRVNKSWLKGKDYGQTGWILSQTTYFGSPDSARITRVYPPLKKHKVKNCTDLECQYRGKWAKAAMNEINKMPAEPSDLVLSRTLANLAISHIDFLIPRGKESHNSRLERHPKWQAVLDCLGLVAIKLNPPKRKSNLITCIRALERQYANCLTAIHLIGGRLKLHELVDQWVDSRMRKLPDKWVGIVDDWVYGLQEPIPGFTMS